MPETPRTIETVTDALMIAEMLVQRMEDGVALSDRLEAWTDHRDELIAEHLELAYELAQVEHAHYEMEGLELDGLNLVIASSVHRLSRGICVQRWQTELYRRVALDRLHALALEFPDYASREKSWADILDPFSTACLRDMLEHAERLVANPPSDWTPSQYGAARLWVERMLCQLAKREQEVTV